MMIRQVTHGDFDRVVALLQQLWPGKRIQYDGLQEVLEKYIEESNYWIYGYEEGGVILGIITLFLRWTLFYEGKVAVIEDLIVDKDHRGKGVGWQLVGFAEDRLAVGGEVKGIELSSDLHRKAAHEFWEKCGYSKLAVQFRKEI
jgi:GNAT superfamily N-acetyltransferase